METLLMPSRSEASSNKANPDTQNRFVNYKNAEAHQSEPKERCENNHRSSADVPDGGVGAGEHSTLKTLLQAPRGNSAMSFVSSPSSSMKLTSRWRAESASGELGGSSQRSPIHASDGKVASSFVPTEQNHAERINHRDKDSASNREGRDKNGPSEEQVLPLDLSCKNPGKRSQKLSDKFSETMQTVQHRREVQNGESSGESRRRQSHVAGSPPEMLSSPVKTESEEVASQPAKVTATFDPLFILSQVACEKLSELQQTEPEKKTSGKGKGSKSKKNKKGSSNRASRKSKKKDKVKSKESDQDDAVTIERVENGKVVTENPAPGIVNNHSGNSMYSVHENESKHQNGYPSSHVQYQSQMPVGGIPSGVQVSPNMAQDTRVAATNTQNSDFMELSPRRKHEGSVNEKTQVEGMADKKYWPFTCRTCNTRFKNAAFLKIHEKIAHENKMARTDATGNRIKFVPKDVNPAQVTKENGTPNPFPIHWKNPSPSASTDRQQGYTAIPCILKVHRQTSTSEMSSSFVKMDGDATGTEDGKGFQCKFEADVSGRRAAEILTGGVTESGEFGSQHPRPKLEVDGSSYEIIKVERERSASGENPSSQSSGKGVQHKFYLQICDRNQTGKSVDSTVKIEKGTSLYSLEEFDDVDGNSDLKRSVFEGNPNQVRVPTSLALKFIPGGSGDSQHKVYLKIADGQESSIRIKTGNLKSQSPSMLGGTAVKIESTYMNEMPRQLHVNDTTRPHKCHYCPKHFPSISALTAHERIHTGEKPYECRFCGRAFYHQNDRRKHERIHTGEKPYECSICGQKFTNKGQVKIHERNHTGERPYQCRHCHKCFKSISNVNRHEKIHTGLKPYTCPVCCRGFSRREHVRTHEEICRKKMLEEDEELADDPIGNVKLPLYRKIRPDGESPVGERSPTFKDEPPEKRSRFEDGERSLSPDEKHWSVKQTNKEFETGTHPEFRRSYSEPVDMYDTRRSPEVTARDRKEPDKVSPLLYNSGPPVKPEAVSSGTGHVGVPAAINPVKNTPVNRRDYEKLLNKLNPSSNDYIYDKKPPIDDAGSRYMPASSDPSKASSGNPLSSVQPETHEIINKVKPSSITPPVLYVPGSGDRKPSESVSQYPQDKPPLFYVNAPKSVSKPPVVVKKQKPDSDKLSAHIEALEPYPEQTAMLNLTDMDKKEPRHYVCGPHTQQTPMGASDVRHTKLSESIPENDRLRHPMVSSVSNSQRMPVAHMYSSSPQQAHSSIPVNTPLHRGSPGGESPPDLTLDGTNEVSKPIVKQLGVNELTKLGGSKSRFEEPPILDRNSPQVADSSVSTVPPLLERGPSVESGKLVMVEAKKAESNQNVQTTDNPAPSQPPGSTYVCNSN